METHYDDAALGRLWRSTLVLSLLVAAIMVPARAQTVDDGLVMPSGVLGTGLIYGHESWDHYWEGTLHRDNDNIGTLATQSVTALAGYGLTDALTVMAMLPYVWTRASEGVLHEMHGLQDITVAAKYRVLTLPFTDHGRMQAFVVGVLGLPVGDYTPDFLPLSIGLASDRVSARFTLNFLAHSGWFMNASTAYTWRSQVKLDRPSYYTDGHLYMSDEVAMPDVFDYAVSAGYRKGRLHIPLSLVQQVTLGGGDIRRQDMPFVSNRMNFVRVDGAVTYALRAPENVGVRLGVSRIVAGRNVGESSTLTAGLFYTFHL